ncbi:MAG: hypothetical protein HY927_04110 [Elusimicrobia bacterium]|nr:hypothetical protein [Elusimicrobiota bacterium]
MMRRCLPPTFRLAKRLLSALVCLSLVSPSPWVASSFAAVMPQTSVPGAHPGALALIEDLARMLAPDAKPRAGQLLQTARQLQKSYPGNKALGYWVEGILAGPLTGLPDDAIPSNGMLQPARDSLPVLRQMVEKLAPGPGQGTDDPAGSPSLMTAESRIKSILSNVAPAGMPQDGVLPGTGLAPADAGALTRPRTPAVGQGGLPSEADLLAEVRRAREELAARDRLSQKADLEDPAAKGKAEELRQLDELLRGYEGTLSGADAPSPGLRESGELRQAALSALRGLMKDFTNPPPVPNQAAPDRPLTEVEKKVSEALDRMEKLKTDAQGQVAERDVAAGGLSTADKVRSGALRERRSGKEMLEFRKNFSRLAVVMDLSYSLNILNSADAALSGMLDLIDKKIKKIETQNQNNLDSAAWAAEQKKKKDEWNKTVDATLAENKQNVDDFASLAKKSARFVIRVEEFRTGVAALLAQIDARDKGSSATAVEEYNRRLALLPTIQQNLISGSGSGSGGIDISLNYLQAQSQDVAGYLTKLQGAVEQIDNAPLEFAGVMVILVPGIPAVSVNTPSAAQVLQILSDRKVYWQKMLDDHNKMLQTVDNYLDPGNSKRVIDDFGDSIPESLAVWVNEERALSGRTKVFLGRLAGAADEIAQRMASQGASLPMLSGKPPSELRTVLEPYIDQVMALNFPGTDEGFEAQMDKLALANILCYMADATAVAIVADSKVEILQRAISNILPKARARFVESTGAIRAVLQDIDMDVAFVNAGFPTAELQSVINRKRTLVGTTLKGMLERMQVFLDQVVIPFWQERIATADPNFTGDCYALLYKEKAKLYERIKKALDRTVPWALASNGAPEGNTAQAIANIEKLKKDFQKYLDLVADLKDTIRRRMDPNGTETEDVYGEQAPFSFIVRAKKYRQVKVDLAATINTRAGEINGILKQMDDLSASAHNLASRFSLPTTVTGDGPEWVVKLRKMADDRVLQNMADAIKKIAEDAQAAAGGTSISVGGGSSTPPTGTQPPLEISNQLKLALLGLEVCKRLVPTQNFNGTSFAEVMARYLFADALVVTSDQYVNERIPIFSTFLDKGQTVLNELFADFDADIAYVSGDGSGGAALLERKFKMYTKVRDTAKEGAELFGLKTTWDTETYGTINTATMYYETMGEVYNYGNQALDKDLQSAQQMRDAVAKQLEDIRKQKVTVTNWLAQLNDPHESALNRVAQNISAIQEKTRAVVEANVNYHEFKDAYEGANKHLQETLAALSREQTAFFRLLEEVGDVSTLNPALAGRVTETVRQGSSWLATGAQGPQTLIIPKSRFSNFLGQLFSSVEPESSSRDIVALRNEILKNPMALAQLLPNSKMVEVGEGSDGFYLVYQSEFSTPYGLETSNQVTMGNVLRLWNSNVSVTGYKFASPPSDVNAPFGDQGISMQIETLDNKHFVNYLDVTFHKFIQDIPADLSVRSEAQEARMMIFDDFALVAANGKLYFGAAGFGDFALSNTSEKPYYYGGNFKASVKFTEVLSLNAEEQLLFAKDPRKFFQTVNLDFTKLDPDLNHDYIIAGEGENKEYRRDKVGVGADLQAALKTKDSFNVELYFARVSGTDDYNQDSVGATVLKGFTFDVGGVPVKTSVGGGAEFGTEYNSYNGRLNFELPNQGLVLSATGKMIGDAETYFVELRKKLGANSEAFASYGSRYIGLNNRLTVGVNTSFTLGELWRAATKDAADTLNGGESMAGFNGDLEAFFKRDDPANPVLAELKKVFDADVGKKLMTLEIGKLGKDIAELRKAGAILDNTRVGAMIGFVSNPVSGDAAERAATGGFQAGTRMDYTMSKTQRALLESKISSIYAESVKLQIRLLELAKAWQLALTDMVQTRWEAALAVHMSEIASDGLLKAEAKALFIDAQARHRQAALRYNALTGRGPDDAVFFDLNPQDLDRMMGVLEKALADPRRLSILVGSLRNLNLPKESLNVMDWIPWIERLTFYVGVQLQDMLSSQILGAGVSVRLPIYEPGSKAADGALWLQNEAIINEMAQSLRNVSMRAQSEKIEADSLDARGEQLAGRERGLSQDVWDAVRGYRNGLVEQGDLWEKVRRWRWTLTSHMASRTAAALKSAWAVMDFSLARSGEIPQAGWRGTMTQPTTLAEGIDLARKNSLSLEALALRSQAAKELVEASSHRFAKVSVDINVGVNITAAGVAWIPAFGLTGLAVFPIFNVDLRPEELEALSQKRYAGEAGLYTQLQSKVSADLAMQLFEAYAAYKSLSEIIGIYEAELVPQLQLGVGSEGLFGLDKARSELVELKAKRQQALSLINFMMGRPLIMPLDLNEGLDAALAKLGATFAKDSPMAASLDVLRSRLEVARAAETIVDKNLQVQNIRFDPISLIGRSLGRLINALSGEGMASPEMLAMARYQTLGCEQDLAAFEKGLGATKAKISFELARIERQMAELQGRNDPRSRIELASLKSRLYSLKAMALFFGVGGEGGVRPQAQLPGNYGELKAKLEEAYARETYTRSDVASSRPTPSELPINAQGNLRYYYVNQSLSKEPIGKHLVEGWIEVRLKSASTPPEALIALANLQKDRADQLFRAESAASRAKAEILLSRLKLYKGLRRGGLGAGAAVGVRDRLSRDFAELSAHLGLAPSVTIEQVLALLPEDGVDGPEAAARRYIEEVASLDLEHLKRTLFFEGLPAPLGGSADPLLQLKANLIAEKMSYKGFTPMAAFGMFRGTWVSGFFLEAPNPEQIQKGLANILTDALKKELESQDKLRSLGLKLHQLMASVADKVRLLDAERERLLLARRNLAGMLERRKLGMASEADVLAASEEAARTHDGFIDTISALQQDFAYLVTELEALGFVDRKPVPRLTPSDTGPQVNERSAKEKLMGFVSERMLDEGFEKNIDELLAGVPARLKEELKKNIEEYRAAKRHDIWVRYDDFTAAEKLQLLIKVDLQGRRELVEKSFQKILDELSRSQGPSWQKVMAFLASDLEGQEAAAKVRVNDGAEMRDALQQAFWSAVTPPAKVDKIYQALSSLSREVDAARIKALEMYLAGAERPEDYLMRDAALDEYVKALVAYDAAVLKAFASADVQGSAQWSKALDALFSLRKSSERRRDYLRYGRGIMTIDAAIGLAEGRLLALRADPEDLREVAPAAESVAFLRAMRERWIGKPSSIDSLLYLKPEAAEDKPEWLTEKDVKKLGSRVVEVGGRRYLLPESWVGKSPTTPEEVRQAKGREVVAGLDAQTDKLQQARKEALAIQRQRGIDASLARAELALAKDADDGPGVLTGNISLAKLRSLERQGRVFYFSADPDRSGRRPFIHPVSALGKSPASLIIMVQVWGPNLPSDQFSCLEDLRSSAWKGAFEKVEFGPLGVQALIAEAKEAEAAARRSGWLSLKLEGYAYAMEGNDVVEVFLDDEAYKKALERSKDPKDPSNKWTFHKVSDLRVGLDSDDRVVGVQGQGFDIKLGERSATRWLSQELLALVADPSGKVVKTYTASGDLEKDASAWWLEDVTGKVYKNTEKEISPTHRLKRYIDPSNGLAVQLGRPILERRLDEAKDEKGDVGRWSYMPWNWPNIVLELPRGIVKVPVEMITGRDPNQEGYIGRVYMYQTEGGATRSYGVVGTVLRIIDIFEILPDPVQRYYDPSQFPNAVNNSSPVRPGEWEHEKSPETTDGKWKVRFGEGYLVRSIRYATEDQEDSRGRIMAAFSGGVRRNFVESVRGRSGTYAESRVDNLQGMIPAEEVLRRVGASTDADGRARVDARPEHIAVDRVIAEIEIRLGASQHLKRQQVYEEYLKTIQTRIQKLSASSDAAGAAAEVERLETLRRSLSAAMSTATPWEGYPAPVPPLLFSGPLVGVR